MAYNPYFPYQQNFPQYQYPNNQQYPNNNQGMIWVSGYNEAATYPVAPNNAIPLWDSSANIVYVKKADQSGKPTIIAYDLVERAVDAFSSQGDKNIGYATKNDLKGVLEAVNGIDDVVKSLNEEIDGIKAEMSKRRRKREADDE